MIFPTEDRAIEPKKAIVPKKAIEPKRAVEPTLVYTPNHIGDTVMAVSAVRRLAESDSEALWLIANPLVAPIWRRLHRPDRVLLASKSWGEQWQLIRRLREIRPGRAYILPGATRAALIAAAAGIPVRRGYDGDLKRYFLSDVPELPGEGDWHKSLDYYALIHGPDAVMPLLGNTPPERGRLWSQLAEPFARRGDDSQPHPQPSPQPDPQSHTIALIPGAARGPAKRWPIGNFAEVAGRLLEASPKTRIEVLGSGDDRPLGQFIRDKNVKFHDRIEDRTGQTSIDAWLSAIAASGLVLCNDSGGMHVADGFGRPLVAVFGTTDPTKTGPASPESIVIQKSHFATSEKIARDSKEGQRALAAISADEVFRQCVKMLDWLT